MNIPLRLHCRIVFSVMRWSRLKLSCFFASSLQDCWNSQARQWLLRMSGGRYWPVAKETNSAKVRSTAAYVDVKRTVLMEQLGP